jgi:hypothetical protein
MSKELKYAPPGTIVQFINQGKLQREFLCKNFQVIRRIDDGRSALLKALDTGWTGVFASELYVDRIQDSPSMHSDSFKQICFL